MPTLDGQDGDARALVRFQHAIDVLAEAFYALDADWRFTAFNRAAEQFLDIPATAVLGKNIWEIFPQGLGTDFEQACRLAKSEGKHSLIHTPSLLNPGRHVELRIGPLDDGVCVAISDVTGNNIAHRRLQESEERLRLATDRAGIGVYDLDLSTGVGVWSASAFTLLGLEPVGDGVASFALWRECIHPDDLLRVEEEHAKAALAGGEWHCEYRILRKNSGEVRHLEAYGRFFRQKDGSIRSIGVALDITDRKRVELELRESEERFRTMADSTPAPAWVTNAAGHVVFANRAFSEVAGRPAIELLGDAWIQLLHPADRPRVSEVRTKAWSEGFTPYSWEGRLKGADGRWLWMHVASSPRFDAAGTFQGYVGIAIDVTEARRAQEELQASERRLRLALESSNAGAWSWSAFDDELELSDIAADLLGVKQRLSWRELQASIDEPNRKALAGVVRAALADRTTWEAELEIVRLNDSRRLWIWARGQALFDGDRRLAGMIGLVTDISERKKQEEKERLLVREVDHRAKNVLAIVQALARLTPFQSKEQYLHDYLGRISALGRVHGLLSTNQWSHVDLERLLADELAPMAGERRGRLSLMGETVSLGPSVAQPLSMIIHELATNAVKYGSLHDDAGSLVVNWRLQPNGSVELLWAERCSAKVGAPAKSGFGASLIDNAIKQIGGQILREWGEHGLLCTIAFPGGEAGAAPTIEKPDNPARAGASRLARVLIVEDEPIIARELSTMLEGVGLSVVGPAHSIEEALHLVLNAEFDCALLDVNLGGRHIAPVLEALSHRAAPFALVTGYEDPGVRGPLIKKPVTPEQVLAVVRQISA